MCTSFGSIGSTWKQAEVCLHRNLQASSHGDISNSQGMEQDALVYKLDTVVCLKFDFSVEFLPLTWPHLCQGDKRLTQPKIIDTPSL